VSLEYGDTDLKSYGDEDMSQDINKVPLFTLYKVNSIPIRA
jgi:hypothetical protein